jgi:hypothetical protein
MTANGLLGRGPSSAAKIAERLVRRVLETVPESALEAAYRPSGEDDPGFTLLLTSATAVVEALALDARRARRQQHDDLYVSLIGPPRRARAGRALLLIEGPPGAVVPPGSEVRTADGSRRALLASRAPALLAACVSAGFTCNDGTVIGADWLVTGEAPAERTPSPYAPVVGVRVGLKWRDGGRLRDGAAARRARPAGLVWDLPACLGRRVTAAHAVHDGLGRRVRLRCRHDPSGRLLVALRRVGHELPDRVELSLTLAPAEQRHAGRIRINAFSARVASEGNGSGPLSQFVHRERRLQPSEPWPDGGWPARPGEMTAAWRRRGAEALRSADRAVTRDDVRATVEGTFPDLVVLDVSPARVGPSGGRRDAVRVTVGPRSWSDPTDLFNRVAAAADRVARALTTRLPMGSGPVVGAPVLALPEGPALDERLSLYTERIVTAAPWPAWHWVDSEGVDWPVFTPEEVAVRVRGGNHHQ